MQNRNDTLGVDTTPFFYYYTYMNIALSNMERDKLKLIVRNLKLLVDALESEVYSDVEAYTVKEDYVPPLADYEEVFEDDE